MTLALGFLNPWALWLLPLAAVPIVIHLLNRRRYKKVRWAAMEFLLAAMKRNRRRMRMEQWLILALRTLAVLLLVLVVSRPRLDEAVFGSARGHHIVCIDDSASMSHRGAGETAWAEAVASVDALATRLAEDEEGDLLTVFLASDPDHPVLPVIRVGPGIASRVRDALAEHAPGAGVLDPRAALSAASRVFEAGDEAEVAEYYLVTDLRKIDWLDDGGDPEPGALEWLLAREADSESVTVLAVGSANCENLAVTSITCRERVLTVGLPLTFRVEVENLGLDTSTADGITIEIDDRTRSTYPLPPLGAGEATTLEVSHTFHRPGPHGVVARLPQDRYAADDVRALAFDVRERSRVLLVDGDPGDDPEEAETYYLHAALEIRGAVDSGVEARLIADHELGDLDEKTLAEFDMVWLCNVARPPAQAIALLERFVQDGGGLAVFAGDQVDLAHYDATVWNGGEGILTSRLVAFDGDMDAPRPVHLADKDSELFAVNTEETEFMFEQLVSVGRWVEVEHDPTGDREVLLRIGTEDGPPLLVSRDLGRGRTFLVTTGADAHWSTWPLWPVYVMSAIAMHRAAARPQDLTASNLGAEDVATFTLDSGRYRTDVSVESKADTVGDVQTFSAPPDPAGPTKVEVPMRDLDGLGLFEVALTRHDGRVERRLLSRSGHADEGKLERLSRDAFARTYPEQLADRVTVVEGRGDTGPEVVAAAVSGTWRWLGFALLAGMLLETLLAWRFGRR